MGGDLLATTVFSSLSSLCTQFFLLLYMCNTLLQSGMMSVDETAMRVDASRAPD